MFVTARNSNLESHLNDYIENRRLRWVYLRDRHRNKIGCLVTYQAYDTDTGLYDLYVGVSKANIRRGDKFSLDLGLIKAINNSVRFSFFIELYQNGELPKLPLTWKCNRNEFGQLTGGMSWYDQYEHIVQKLIQVYSKMFDKNYGANHELDI